MRGPDRADGFDIRRFTLRQLAAVEQVVGVPLDQFNRAPSRARLIAALVWQQRVATDPDATLDDVLDMTMDDMTKELGVAAETAPDPSPVGSGT